MKQMTDIPERDEAFTEVVSTLADSLFLILSDDKGDGKLADALQECLLKMMWKGFWDLVENSDGPIFGEYLESPETDSVGVAKESTAGEDHDF